MCGEEIAAAARKCKHCGEFLDGTSSASVALAPPPPPPSPAQNSAAAPLEKSEGMVFCRGCGKKLHCSAVACPHCGASQVPSGGGPGGTNEEGMIWVPISSLVVGIICALACFDEAEWDTDTAVGCSIFAIAGLVLGIISLNKQRRGRGMAIAGVILSAISLLVYLGSMCK